MFYINFTYLALLPLGIALIFMAFFHIEKLMWFIIFATPLSFVLEIGGHGGIGMSLPTDPLMFGVMLLFLFKLIYHKSYDKKIVKHPVTIAICIKCERSATSNFFLQFAKKPLNLSSESIHSLSLGT